MTSLYTDGALRRYPDFIIGAWCYYLFDEKETFSHAMIEEYKGITNNQMEMKAIINGLKHIKPGESVTVYTDSQYCVYGFKRNFESKTNVELWQQMKQAVAGKNVQIEHVDGHADCLGNNVADLTMRAMLDPLVKRRKNQDDDLAF